MCFNDGVLYLLLQIRRWMSKTDVRPVIEMLLKRHLQFIKDLIAADSV